jgi:hypothetical protein
MGWSNSSDIDEYLIPDINKVLDGTEQELENGSEIVSVVIQSDWVTFYLDRNGSNYPQINTNEFKEIVEGWRDFLLQPPLNNTKVSLFQQGILIIASCFKRFVRN